MKKITKFSSFLSVLLVFSIAWGSFGLPTLAYEKKGINFKQVENEFLSKTKEQTNSTLESSTEETIDKQPKLEEERNKIGGLEKFSLIKQGNKNYVEGEVLVKYKSDKINLNTSSGKTAALNFISSNLLEKKEDLIEANISLLKIKDGKTVEEKIAELKNNPNVEYAQPNFQYYLLSINTNDTYKDLLWGLDNTGQSVNGVSGSNDADIDVPESWAISETTTSTPVIVAIIDSGVAYNHPDLLDNMWDGTSCVTESGSPLGGCQYGYDYEDGDKIPLPTSSSHGTHIAGTIAAAKNNNLGIIGVAPNAKIMAIKSSLTTDNIIKSISFAAKNGAKIINASWGDSNFDQSLKDAIASFPGLFIAAAGNCGDTDYLYNGCTSQNQTLYPASYDLSNIISVAATDQNDALTSFSNYSATSVDVGAPGTNIYSTGFTQELFTNAILPSFTNTLFTKTSGGWKTGTWADVGGDGSDKNAQANSFYINNDDGVLTLTAPLDTTVHGGNVRLSFYLYANTESPFNNACYDYLKVEVDNNDNNWVLKYLNCGYINGQQEVNLGTGKPNMRVHFVWHTNDSVMGSQVPIIDDITISNTNSYQFMNGTSMAAPHVAGLAALVWGTKPSLTYSDVKNSILDTGDSLSSLATTTVTGKRINAFNALDSVTPPVISDVQTATTTAISTIVTWTTDLPATSKVAYSTTTPVSSTIVSDDTPVTNHSIELIDLSPNTTYYFYTESSDKYGNIATSTEQQFQTLLGSDTEAPVIDSFTIPATSTSLTVPITSFEATDNVGVTGYLLNETSTTPLIDDLNWATTTPASYIFSSEGFKTLYAWAKDAANNISTSSSASVTITLPLSDTTPPTLFEVTPILTPTNDNTPDYTFNSDEAGTISYEGGCISSTTEALVGDNTITFNSLTDGTYNSCTIIVTDEAGNPSDPLVITEFIIDTEPPVITLIGSSTVDIYVGDAYEDEGATATDDIDGDITGDIITNNPVDINIVGTYLVTYNVTDTAGNPAEEVIRTVNISEPPDIEAPVITSFIIPATSTSLTVPIISFEATDNAEVTGYLLNETSTIPLLDDSNWSITTSTTYTFDSEGFKTLYAWAKDAANNISTSSSASVTITFKNITSVSSLNDINVPYGTPFASLALPETVEVTLDDTSTTTLQVIWAEGTYDGSVSGEYILEGAITLTPEISNSSNLKASIKITVEKNTAKAITSFKFESLSPEVVGTIDEINYTISLTVPYGTDVTNLVPTISVSPNATSSPASGIAQDFTSPVTYTVTAEDDSTQDYVVTVVVSSPPTTTTTTTPPAGGGGDTTTTRTITTTTTTKPSSKIDTNQDGKIDIFDFNSLMINWEKKEANNIADFDGNGQVDIFDFNLLMINWTQ